MIKLGNDKKLLFLMASGMMGFDGIANICG